MSPFEKPVVLDNTCVVNFYLANALETVLTMWPFRVFLIPRRVFTEASHWREHGEDVCSILARLEAATTISLVSIDEDSEVEVDAYALLRLQGPLLGEGESECMAMSVTRGYIVATDDGIATERCREVFPQLEVVTSADILKMARADGLLKESGINEIWRRIKKRERHTKR